MEEKLSKEELRLAELGSQAMFKSTLEEALASVARAKGDLEQTVKDLITLGKAMDSKKA